MIIVALAIALSGDFNGNLEFQIISNQKTGEPLGVCMSLFVYVLMLQGAAKRGAPKRDLEWGPELKVSRKY